MKRRLTAINVVHNRAGEARPALRSEYPLSEVWRRYVRTVGGGVEKVAAATPEILRMLLEGSRKAADDEDASIHLRDRVLILVGFAGALRVSEMVGLQQKDVSFRHGGLELTLRGAKTDHDREGQTIFIHRAEAGACPVGAMKAWLDRLRDEVGPPRRRRLHRTWSRSMGKCRGKGDGTGFGQKAGEAAKQRSRGRAAPDGLRRGFIFESLFSRGLCNVDGPGRNRRGEGDAAHASYVPRSIQRLSKRRGTSKPGDEPHAQN